MFTRIQWRIAFSYVGLIAFALLVLGGYLIGLLRAQQLDSLEGELGRQARLVAEHAEDRLATDGPAALDSLAKQLGRDAEVRVTLIATDGTVLGDSEADPATMDNHAGRPEVVQALAQGTGISERRSATLEQDLLYVAVPMERGGVRLGVARVALPVRQIREALDRVAIAIAGAFVVVAMLATVLAVLVARTTTGPIQVLTESARQLAGGDLHHPIRVDGRDEVSDLARAFNDMAIRLRNELDELADGRARLEAVLDHMADGLLVVDADETVLLINPAAARLLEVSPVTMTGRSLTTVLRDHELVAAVREAVDPATAELGTHLVELGQASRQRSVQVVATQISTTGMGRRVLVLLQDVTELRRAEVVRREFVANVSHELRTPVAALKALVETLDNGALEDPPAARDFLGRMHVEVDGLAQLVEELLELSRIESGRLPLRVHLVDLGTVVASAADRLRPQAERQGVRLLVDAWPDNMPQVQADPERIQQVVVNLVHNAVKFTPPGGTIRVRVEPRDGEVAVLVQDTGIGIAAEALPRLFERFYKSDRARSGGGTGLGLAIAKHLVQAHGGRIWADSAGEGLGATFTFTLPT